MDKISFSHVKFYINQSYYHLDFWGIKAYFRKSNFLSNRGLMFHWKHHHRCCCMKTTGRLFPMDETLKLARAHPYVAVLRNGTWNFMQTSPEGELPICKEEATFDIFSWRVTLTKKTRLHLLIHAGEWIS